MDTLFFFSLLKRKSLYDLPVVFHLLVGTKIYAWS